MEVDMSRGTDRGRRDLDSAVKSHYDKVEAAIRTGKMSNVKAANNSGYSNEKRQIRGAY
jgi:hypothetical protein